MTEMKQREKKPFIGMHYRCCHVYNRLYLNKDKSAFVGHCPKCGIQAKVLVSKDGSKGRFFTAE